MNSIYFFAGENSGDFHGSLLMEALQKHTPQYSFIGVGGPKMRKQGIVGSISMESFQVMGLSDVLKNIHRLFRLFYQVRDEILHYNPEKVILIDYPHFNLRLASSLRKKGYRGKIVQYVCPTVWAHGKNRIKTLVDNFDLLLTIYPFEKDYFLDSPLKVAYIGHPLATAIASHPYQKNWFKQLGMKDTSNLIALFPGSRKSEIDRHAPQQLKVAEALLKQHPHLQFGLSCAHENLHSKLVDIVKKSSVGIELQLEKNLFIVPSYFHYELMRDALQALAKSGTVTLELALHEVPTIVHYDLTLTNYLFAKYILRLTLPHYCMVNILMNKTVFPELIDHQISQNSLNQLMCDLYENNEWQTNMKSQCKALKRLLDPPAGTQVATVIGTL